MAIQVEIVTPRRQLFGGEVEMITLPGVEGEMGVLHNHAPLLTLLDIGAIVLHHTDGREEFIAVSGGVVEVRPNKVVILARSAERADEIDIERAEAALGRARESVQNRPTGEHREPAVAALRRSQVRLKVARRRRQRQQGGAYQESGE